MDAAPTYNLLQSIDPTKVKVPICDRFAKLTLSSNKKKKQQEQNVQEHQADFLRQQEKRESVSRNISKQFEMETAEEKETLHENPLLRSESSKDTEQKISNENFEDEEQHDEITMDPLQVSEDYENPSHLNEDLELLSQKISALAVDSAPISVSSESTDNLASTESQCSGASAADHLHIVRHIPINVKEALKQDTILLNLTNSTRNEDGDKTYEMTEDEGVSEVDEESAITISDTSESHHDQEQDVMTTSSIPSNSQTSGILLPCLTDDKAERVAAFLRDVSIERRAMIEQGQIGINDTVDQLIDNSDIDKIQETLERSRQIATADTESMTEEAGEEVVVIPQPIIERDRRMKALDNLISKQMQYEDKTEVLNKEPVATNDDKSEKQYLKCAHDETQFDEEKTPKNPTIKKANIYTLNNDEKENSLDFSLSQLIETPKNATLQENKGTSRRLANAETQENTLQPVFETKALILGNSVTKNSYDELYRANDHDNDEKNPHKLANDDTVTNSTMADMGGEILFQVSDLTESYKTPERSNKTEENCFTSIHSTPQTSDGDGSIKNSSFEINNCPTPEESLIIPETDDEGNASQQQQASLNSEDNKKLSNSLHNNEETSSSFDDSQNVHMSRLQMPMGNISISAKINIKIRIPTRISMESSEDDENDNQDNPKNKTTTEERWENVSNKASKQLEKETSKDIENHDRNLSPISNLSASPTTCNQVQKKVTEESVLNCSDISSDSVEVVEDEKFLTEAQLLLNKLYGKSWQTPEVMRTLKRSSQSNDKKSNKTSSKKGDNVKSSKDSKSVNKSKVEESGLDDFSIFRRNIVKTNLDSTRLAITLKTPAPLTQHRYKEIRTEPRNGKLLANKTEAITSAMAKSFQTPVAKSIINRRRGIDNGRWRHLIDNDSNSEADYNASDDDDADESWSKNASEIEKSLSNSDFEISPNPSRRNKRVITTTRLNNKSYELAKRLNNTSNGELVYLDLSKEEVEIQEEVPDSPPVNHDATFASRLQEILKTCRHEDNPKLPLSSAKKTKRKLFTPAFGDDVLEGSIPLKEEEKNKEDSTKPINNKKEMVEEILEDYDNCPFDSQGRSKVLSFFNKPLESIKKGKPANSPKKTDTAAALNFNIEKNTEESESGKSSRNKIKSQTDKEPFKTPLSVKSKVPVKSLQHITKTPNFKYSFLKSLDETVSKSLCHPDALYYRDNYRLKKEELSQILYDLYNEKLFENKLNVLITWNKKLSNTAGRCLNRKRMGTRTCVIELSIKVLTSADRLRCTLIHELCHAATWIFDGEGGHGQTWKTWARKANATFPEIPKIGVCHQYDIEYKYTYKCTLCAAKSHAHSKSKKVENIRCSYCHGAIEIFLNKKDKDGNIIPTPVKEPTGFAKFVKDNYKKLKRDDLKHADVMKLLSNEFASMKVVAN